MYGGDEHLAIQKIYLYKAFECKYPKRLDCNTPEGKTLANLENSLHTAIKQKNKKAKIKGE